MTSPHTICRLRLALAASLVLAALGVAPARAASFTVFWNRADFGFGAGIGVSAATVQSANSAGIPTVTVASIVGKPSTLVVDHTLDESTLNPPFPVGAGPATITSNWSAINNTGINSPGTPQQTLYLIFEQPVTNDEFFVNGQQQLVTYEPSDVGLTLSNDGNGSGVDWVILQLPVANDNTLYYPAVSLGPLANGATAAFPLLYTLNHPQVFTENFNYELGMPKWSLDFASISAAIPEPSSGLLVLLGLLGIAGGRRKHS